MIYILEVTTVEQDESEVDEPGRVESATVLRALSIRGAVGVVTGEHEAIAKDADPDEPQHVSRWCHL